MSRKRISSCLIATVLAAAAIAAQPVSAQTAPARRWSLITIVTIKPGVSAEYEQYQKQVMAAYKKAEVPSRAVLRTVLGDLNEYVTVVPLAHFADMDGSGPMERALGKEGAAALQRKGAALMTSIHRFASMDLPDLSILTESAEPLPYAMVTTLHLANGKGPEYAAWVKNDYLPAAKKAELKNLWISQTVFGGDPNERVVVRPLKAMGDLDAGPFTVKALGAEGAQKMMSKSAGIIASAHYRVVRYQPELSYERAPPKAAASR